MLLVCQPQMPGFLYFARFPHCLGQKISCLYSCFVISSILKHALCHLSRLLIRLSNNKSVVMKHKNICTVTPPNTKFDIFLLVSFYVIGLMDCYGNRAYQACK